MEEEKTIKRKIFDKGGYIEAIGRRKTSVARIRITKGKDNKLVINQKSLEEYCPIKELQKTIKTPLSKIEDTFEISVKVSGGGISSQAEAIRHGISRSIVIFNPSCRKDYKKDKLLKRDPRKKERKKPGLKKARKAPQWSKR